MTAGDAGSPGSAARGHLALVCACFLLSGLSALVFQVAWIEELTRVFGASQPAVAAVLAAYMGGLAAGAGIAARWLLPRLGRPILAYAWIELAIGASALAVPFMVDAAARLQAAVFESGARGPGFAMVFSLAVAFLVLIVPTSLMGATLPILARFVITAEEHIGSRIGALYTTNTLGGALGAWGAAFFLMPSLGLELTVLVAVSINGIVGLLAALAHFLAGGAAAGGPIEEPPERPLEPASPSSESGGGGGVWILPAILISGVISFTYEVLWTRLLSHLLGSSTYAFGTMLATFLVGLALGGAAGGRMARSREAARMQFAVTQVAIAAVSWAAFVNLDRLAGLQQVPFTGAVPGPPGALLCAATLLPGAFFIGATFPQAVRALAPSARGTAVASGRVLVWNTCGAIAGATGAGFLLLPALRFSGTLAACVAASLALAAAASLVERPRRKGWALGCLAGLAVFGSLAPPPPDSLIRSSPFSGGPRQGSLDFYAVGRTSTVTALGTAAGYRLSTDGLPEAVLQRPGALASRFSIARWLSLLPVAYRPDAESMLLVGLGGGLTVEEVPSTVRRIRVVELEAEVLLANRALAAKRRVDPLAD
ncbi:MAG: fused MFS/spermidine synthase, partial [Acidobacteriota bacterium]